MDKCPVMSKKRRNVSSKGYRISESKESLTSSTLHPSLSSMFLRDVDRSDVPRIEAKRSVKRSARTMVLPVVAEQRSKEHPGLGIPEDVAVHFGNFYCVGKESGNNGARGRDAGTSRSQLPVCHSPRSEFTGQMVHKLERLAGTVHYARQISALLEETVESPTYVLIKYSNTHFCKVKQLADDSFPHERFDSSSYPLWYKDPDKINYRSPSNESSRSIETGEETVPTSKMQRCESATSDGSTLINATSKIDSEGSLDMADRENNYESSSIASKVTLNSLETTEDDTECEELKKQYFRYVEKFDK